MIVDTPKRLLWWIRLSSDIHSNLFRSNDNKTSGYRTDFLRPSFPMKELRYVSFTYGGYIAALLERDALLWRHSSEVGRRVHLGRIRVSLVANNKTRIQSAQQGGSLQWKEMQQKETNIRKGKKKKEKDTRTRKEKKRRNYRRDKKQLATGRSVGVAILYIPTSTAAI